MVKAFMLMVTSATMAERGFVHPLGDNWRGYQDINPAVLPRERIIDMLAKTTPEMLRSVIPCGSPHYVAKFLKGFVDAGLRVIKIMDYGGMAGLKYAAKSAQKVRDTEDALMRLCGQEV
jgi:phthiodiolone/phenolphthiodiolone dimycocerosates ketoreductase